MSLSHIVFRLPAAAAWVPHSASPPTRTLFSANMVGSSPPSAGLAAIQAEQEAAAGLKARRLKKSLERIQYEERAMETLTEYYKQTRARGSGEWVTLVQIS